MSKTWRPGFESEPGSLSNCVSEEVRKAKGASKERPDELQQAEGGSVLAAGISLIKARPQWQPLTEKEEAPGNQAWERRPQQDEDPKGHQHEGNELPEALEALK